MELLNDNMRYSTLIDCLHTDRTRRLAAEIGLNTLLRQLSTLKQSSR